LHAGLKDGITVGTGCTTGDATQIIRYSSKASYDGIMALQTTTQYPAYATPVAPGATLCGGGIVPAGQEKFYRTMLCATGSDTLGAVKIDVGMSDVAGETFREFSTGCKLGALTTGYPTCTGGNLVTRNFANGIDTKAGTYNDNDLLYKNPMIVPFGFFANDCVTKTKCLAPTPVYSMDPNNPNPLVHKAVSSWGNQCWDKNDAECVEVDPGTKVCDGGPRNGQTCETQADCGIVDGHSRDCIGYFKCVNNVCAGGVRSGQQCYSINECPDVDVSQTQCERMPIDNISRLMATMIFSPGNATYWQDFGKWFDGDCDLSTPLDPIYPCLRHAGSGTHATMRIMMRGNGWGPTPTPIHLSQVAPYVNFNDGSTDALKCVAGASIAASGTGWSNPAAPNGRNIGAIGYADCDILMGTPFAVPTATNVRYPFENVHALKLDGVECKSAKVRNGEYPFYSVEYMYYDTDNPNKLEIEDLAAFAGNPLNYEQVLFVMPNSSGNEGDFWAGYNEMRFRKSTDTAWPSKASGTSFPRDP
jgi:hypothetical protein